MSIETLRNELIESFNRSFPDGYIKIHKTPSFNDKVESYSVVIGLIDDVKNVNNSIRENDPLFHRFIISIENDIVSAVHISGSLCVNPVNRMYAMSLVKTKFRKTSGDFNKVAKYYDKWFKSLKQLVIDNKDNIFNGDKYKTYIDSANVK